MRVQAARQPATDKTAAGHGGQVIDPAQQAAARQCLQGAQAERGAAYATAGQGQAGEHAAVGAGAQACAVGRYAGVDCLAAGGTQQIEFVAQHFAEQQAGVEVQAAQGIGIDGTGRRQAVPAAQQRERIVQFADRAGIGGRLAAGGGQLAAQIVDLRWCQVGQVTG
jgi:hypothetical protein